MKTETQIKCATVIAVLCLLLFFVSTFVGLVSLGESEKEPAAGIRGGDTHYTQHLQQTHSSKHTIVVRVVEDTPKPKMRPLGIPVGTEPKDSKYSPDIYSDDEAFNSIFTRY